MSRWYRGVTLVGNRWSFAWRDGTSTARSSRPWPTFTCATCAGSFSGTPSGAAGSIVPGSKSGPKCGCGGSTGSLRNRLRASRSRSLRLATGPESPRRRKPSRGFCGRCLSFWTRGRPGPNSWSTRTARFPTGCGAPLIWTNDTGRRRSRWWTTRGASRPHGLPSLPIRRSSGASACAIRIPVSFRNACFSFARWMTLSVPTRNWRRGWRGARTRRQWNWSLAWPWSRRSPGGS